MASNWTVQRISLISHHFALTTMAAEASPLKVRIILVFYAIAHLFEAEKHLYNV